MLSDSLGTLKIISKLGDTQSSRDLNRLRELISGRMYRRTGGHVIDTTEMISLAAGAGVISQTVLAHLLSIFDFVLDTVHKMAFALPLFVITQNFKSF